MTDTVRHVPRQIDAPTLFALDREWYALLDEVYRGYLTIEHLCSVKDFRVTGLERVASHVELTCQQMHVILAVALNNFGQHLGSLRRSKW